jgi:hypothetical protein
MKIQTRYQHQHLKLKQQKSTHALNVAAPE